MESTRRVKEENGFKRERRYKSVCECEPPEEKKLDNRPFPKLIILI
jgi:hypothetical protein